MCHAARKIPSEGLKLHGTVKFCPSVDQVGEMLQRDAVLILKFDAAPAHSGKSADPILYTLWVSSFKKVQQCDRRFLKIKKGWRILVWTYSVI
jgi:hypothetical protein